MIALVLEPRSAGLAASWLSEALALAGLRLRFEARAGSAPVRPSSSSSSNRD